MAKLELKANKEFSFSEFRKIKELKINEEYTIEITKQIGFFDFRIKYKNLELKSEEMIDVDSSPFKRKLKGDLYSFKSKRDNCIIFYSIIQDGKLITNYE